MAPSKTIRTPQSTRPSLHNPHIYEDPDALLNADTDRVQADVKPTPQPRKKKVQFSDNIDAPKQVNAAYINQAVNPMKTQLPPLSSEQKPPIPQKRQNYLSLSYSERPSLVITQTPESYSELPQQGNTCASSTKKPDERPVSPALSGKSPDPSGVDRTMPQPPLPQKRQNPSSSSSSSSYQTPTNYSTLPQQIKQVSVGSYGTLKEGPVSPALSGNSQASVGADQTNSQISGRIIPVPRSRQLSSSSSDLHYDKPSTAQNQTSEPQISGRLTPVPRSRQLSSSSSNLKYDSPSTAQTHIYKTPLYILPPSPQPGSKEYKCRPPYIQVIPDDPNDKTLRKPEPRPPLQRTPYEKNESKYTLNADDITDLLK